MSTEAVQHRRYRFFLVAVLVILVLLAGSLGAANLMQGPRLSAVDVNTSAVTERTGQRLTLHANQPLDPEAGFDVTVAPQSEGLPQGEAVAIDADTEVDGEQVTIQLAEPLRYATGYTVTARVQGLYTGVSGTLRTAFTTVDSEAMTLVRGGGDDRIEVQGLVDPGRHEELFSADRIQEFAALADQLVVVRLDASGTPEVGAVSRDDGSYEPMTGEGLVEVRDLRVEPRSRMAGYLVDEEFIGAAPGDDGSGSATSSVQHGLLLLHDMNDPAAAPTPVLDADEQPLEVAEWAFVDSAVLVRTEDGETYRFDPVTQEVSEPEPGEQMPDPLHDRGADFEVADGAVTVGEDDGGRELFRPAADSSRLGQLCPSPNQEYLAVQVISADGEPDGYPVTPGFTQSTVSFVRVADGAVVRSTNGMMPSWCQA